MGDLNCGPGDGEYELLVERADLVCLLSFDTELDHILAVLGSGIRAIASRRVDSVVVHDGKPVSVSDHALYCAEIEVD